MILDKFRNKYSFNFFATFGWIIFTAYFTFYLLATPYRWYGSAISLITLIIMISTISCLSLSIIIWILEEIFEWQIKNKKFFNNKFVLFLQLLGVIFAIMTNLYFLFLVFS